MRNKSSLAWWLVVLAGVAVLGPQVRGSDKKTFKGTVADSQCALNVHSVTRSHKEMIGIKPEIKTYQDCVRYCVKERGGRFVLLSGDKVYKLDDQAAAELWAGMRVRILGTLDPKSRTISIGKIEGVPDPDNSSAY